MNDAPNTARIDAGHPTDRIMSILDGRRVGPLVIAAVSVAMAIDIEAMEPAIDIGPSRPCKATKAEWRRNMKGTRQ